MDFNSSIHGTALVTGGAGFIGCAISKRLADVFDHVVAVDNLHPQIHKEHRRPSALDPRVELIVADVTDPHTWDTVLDTTEPHTIVHLAAETGTGQSLSESNRHATVNVVGTTQMLDALHRHNRAPHRFVLASSRAVYGEGQWRHNSDGTVFYPGPRPLSMLENGVWDFPDAEPQAMNAKTVECRPASVYGVTKVAQEGLLRLWGDAFGSQVGIVRLQNVYGPGQSLNNPYTGIMSLFCRIAREHKSIPVYEDGNIRRDFILIDDVADAIVRRATAVECPPDPIDIGSGRFETIGNAASMIASIYDAPAPHVTGQFRHGDVRHAWADPAPARDLLGFRAHYGIDVGFRRLVDWIDGQLD